MRMPVLADLLFTIVSGFVERSNDKLRVVVITRSPSIEGQRISESIGIDRMELWSDAAQISDNPNEATIFLLHTDLYDSSGSHWNVRNSPVSESNSLQHHHNRASLP
jgi:hypothetical protein